MKLTEQLTKNFSILGVTLVIAGNVKLFVYYKLFNIEIFSFVELDEILILFMQNAVQYLILVLIFIIMAFFFFRRIDGDEIRSKKMFSKRLKEYVSNSWLFIFFIIFVSCALLYPVFRPNVSYRE